jgi:predicted DNA-binding transcriptional regulator AlpA
MSTMPALDQLLREKEAARFLGVSASWLQKARCYGYGPQFTRVGRRSIRYRRSDLEQYLADNTTPPTGSSRSRRASK